MDRSRLDIYSSLSHPVRFAVRRAIRSRFGFRFGALTDDQQDLLVADVFDLAEELAEPDAPVSYVDAADELAGRIGGISALSNYAACLR